MISGVKRSLFLEIRYSILIKVYFDTKRTSLSSKYDLIYCRKRNWKFKKKLCDISSRKSVYCVIFDFFFWVEKTGLSIVYYLFVVLYCRFNGYISDDHYFIDYYWLFIMISNLLHYKSHSETIWSGNNSRSVLFWNCTVQLVVQITVTSCNYYTGMYRAGGLA